MLPSHGPVAVDAQSLFDGPLDPALEELGSRDCETNWAPKHLRLSPVPAESPDWVVGQVDSGYSSSVVHVPDFEMRLRD